MTNQQYSYILMSVSILYSMFVYINYKIYKKSTIYTLFLLLILRVIAFVWYAVVTRQPAFIGLIFAEILFGSMSMKEVTKHVVSK